MKAATVEVRIADLDPILTLLGDLRDAVEEMRRREQAAVARLNASEGDDDHAAGEGDAYAGARKLITEAIDRLTNRPEPVPADDPFAWPDEDREPF